MNILKICIVFLLLLVYTPAYAWSDKWDAYDTTGQIATNGIIAVDWMQTYSAMARYQNVGHYTEAGGASIFIGEHPSGGTINTYFAIYSIAHPIISYLLPKYLKMPEWVKTHLHINKIPIRNTWQAGFFIAHSKAVYNSYQGGVRIRW